MSKTLLLADDSVTIQKVVGITFANEDVELVTVDNGADALARAKDLKPDLIMADVAMPGLGGYELCASIRRDPELCHIPVLLLTGTFETYDEQRGTASGASGHIAKPFEAQALISQFYSLVDQDATRVVTPPTAPAPAPAAPQPAPVAAAQPTPVAPQPAPPVAQPTPVAPQPAPPVAQPAPAATQPAPQPVAASPQPAPVAAPPVPPAAAFDPLESTFPPTPPAQVMRTTPADLPDLPNTDFAAPGAAAAPTLVADPDAVPSVPEIPGGDDFAFEDLDFNESGPSNTNTDTGIFGADSGSEPTPPAPADPNYGETAFLDPQAAAQAVAHTPDPLADTIPEDPFSNPNDDTNTFDRPLHPPARGMRAQIEEAIPWAEPDPVPAETVTEAVPVAAPPAAGPPVPAAAPVVEDLHAAPLAAQPAAPTPAPVAAPPMPEALIEEAVLEAPEGDTEPMDAMLDAEPLSDDEEFEAATLLAPEAFATSARATTTPVAQARTPVATPEAELFAPEPEPEVDLAPAQALPIHGGASVAIDPADVKSAVEKVAWEAFGALQDQLMRDVTARAEAAIWEIVPQIAERLVREEIERIKQDADAEE